MSEQTLNPTIILILFIIFLFVYLIPSVITTWKLYEKAGKPGWTAIVPVYNAMMMAEIAKKPIWLGAAYGALSIASLFNDWLSLPALVLAIYLLVYFAKQYDRSVGFWAAYILLPIITVFLVKDAHHTGGQHAATDAK